MLFSRIYIMSIFFLFIISKVSGSEVSYQLFFSGQVTTNGCVFYKKSDLDVNAVCVDPSDSSNRVHTKKLMARNQNSSFFNYQFKKINNGNDLLLTIEYK